MVLTITKPGPEEHTGSGSVIDVPGDKNLTVSLFRLKELGIKFRTPEYKARGLSITKRRHNNDTVKPVLSGHSKID